MYYINLSLLLLPICISISQEWSVPIPSYLLVTKCTHLSCWPWNPYGYTHFIYVYLSSYSYYQHLIFVDDNTSRFELLFNWIQSQWHSLSASEGKNITNKRICDILLKLMIQVIAFMLEFIGIYKVYKDFKLR